jgi:hypothetical protein
MSSSDKLALKYKDAEITHVEHDGNYTLVEMKYGEKRVFGLAKRNPQCDNFIAARGINIAVSRALQKLDAELHPRRKKVAKKK